MMEINITALSTALGWTIIHSLWQITLIALIVKVLSSWKQKSSDWQYNLHLTGMAFMFLLCIFSFQKRYNFETKQLQATTSQTINATELANIATKAEAEIGFSLSSQNHFLESINHWVNQQAHWLSLVWLLGVLFLSIRFGTSWFYLKQIKKHKAHDTPDYWMAKFKTLCSQYDIHQKIQLLFSDKVEEPLSFGHLKPIILIPIGLVNSLTTDQVEMILLHELAHIKRYDYFINLIQTGIEVLLFYHPAMWWISREVRAAREHCCDDWVLAKRTDRMAYAQTLTTVQQFNFSQKNQLAMSANGIAGTFTTRIKRLFGIQNKPTFWSSISPIFFIGIMLLLTINFRADAQIQNSFNHPEEVQQILKDFNQPLDHIPMTKEDQVLKTYIYHCPVDDSGRELYVQMELVKGTDRFSARKIRIRLSFPKGDTPIVLCDEAVLPTINLSSLYVNFQNEITDLEIWSSEKALKRFGPKGVEAGVFEIKSTSGNKAIFKNDNKDMTDAETYEAMLELLTEEPKVDKVLKEKKKIAKSKYNTPVFYKEDQIDQINGHGHFEFNYKNGIKKGKKSSEARGTFKIKGGAKTIIKNSKDGPILYLNGQLISRADQISFSDDTVYDSIFYYNPNHAMQRIGATGKNGVYFIYHEKESSPDFKKLKEKKKIKDFKMPKSDFLKGVNNQATIEKYKVYPTAFQERTTIEFSLNLDQKLKIQVRNIWGQLVETIDDRHFQQGNHSLNWEANNLPAGQYFITISSIEKQVVLEVIKQ